VHVTLNVDFHSIFISNTSTINRSSMLSNDDTQLDASQLSISSLMVMIDESYACRCSNAVMMRSYFILFSMRETMNEVCSNS
jgi:hypothetical protein